MEKQKGGEGGNEARVKPVTSTENLSTFSVSRGFTGHVWCSGVHEAPD